MMVILIAAFIATTLSLVLTRLMLKAPIRDIPVERSSHTDVTPRAGGVAIITAFLVYLTFIQLAVLPVFSSYVTLLILLSCTMGVVGFCDDVFKLSFIPRLVLQLLVAYVMVYNGFVIDHIPLPGVDTIPLGPFSSILTLLWIVGFINAFNFMDGLNGLAAGGALIASIMILMFMPVLTPLSFIMYGLIFALVGFLRYNFYKGQIFMGEVGSQFLGCLFAVLTLMLEPVTMGEVRFYIVPLLFLPFIFDTLLTFARRVLQKKNILEPHKEFLFHRLNSLGFGHSAVALIYMFLISLQGIFVYYFLQGPSFLKLGLDFSAYGILSIWVYAKTSSQDRKVEAHA